MATTIHYKTTTLRNLAWPAAIVAAAAVAVPWFGGLQHSVRGAESSRPSAGHQSYVREVLVANPSRGCRWQYTTVADVQIADCGDEAESVRLVFERDRVTEYRITPRQDPNAPPKAAAGTNSITSQPGGQPLPPAPGSGRRQYP
jgi:hypothetical protein